MILACLAASVAGVVCGWALCAGTRRLRIRLFRRCNICGDRLGVKDVSERRLLRRKVVGAGTESEYDHWTCEVVYCRSGKHQFWQAYAG